MNPRPLKLESSFVAITQSRVISLYFLSPTIRLLRSVYCHTVSSLGVQLKHDQYFLQCFLFSLNACFTSDHQTFVQSIKRQTCHGCINHDIVIGLCSELLMRLIYYIHLGFGKKAFCPTWGSNCSRFDCEPSTLPLDQGPVPCFIIRKRKVEEHRRLSRQVRLGYVTIIFTEQLKSVSHT